MESPTWEDKCCRCEGDVKNNLYLEREHAT